jgi:hypothetical protein
MGGYSDYMDDGKLVGGEEKEWWPGLQSQGTEHVTKICCEATDHS